MTNLNEVLRFISQCDNNARDQIIDVLNTQRRVNNIEATKGLRVGSRVSFDSQKKGMTIEGTIIKINRKSVKLDCGEVHGKWSVSPTMINALENN